MKKFAAISLAAAAALASSSALAFFGNSDDNYGDPECWKKGYYDADECRDEWDPRYWMNEFEDIWDNNDDELYRYGGFGGPMMGGPYGGPRMPYGGGYGAPMMPYGGGYGAPMMPYGGGYGAPMAPRYGAPAPVAPYGQRPPYAAPSYAPRPAPAPRPTPRPTPRPAPATR